MGLLDALEAQAPGTAYAEAALVRLSLIHI